MNNNLPILAELATSKTGGCPGDCDGAWNDNLCDYCLIADIRDYLWVCRRDFDETLRKGYLEGTLIEADERDWAKRQLVIRLTNEIVEEEGTPLFKAACKAEKIYNETWERVKRLAQKDY